MKIHREGYTTIKIMSIFLIILTLVFWRFCPIDWLNLILFTFSAFILAMVLWFFRDPQRVVSTLDPIAILAPADGKVVVIEETPENEYFKDQRLMISIFMSPLNVHSNHHPISGTIEYEKYHEGKYLVAWHPKSSTENERHTTVYKNEKIELLTRQIAGALARRIVNYVKKGDKVAQGGDMGFIKFGSRVDIYLPLGTKVTVKLGQTVKAKRDKIAII